MKKSTNEVVVISLSTASILALLFGLIIVLISPICDTEPFTAAASYCLTFCFIPFASLQFFMSAGIYVRFFSELPTLVKGILYFILFPFANLWLVVWFNNIFWHFLPASDSMESKGKFILLWVTLIWIGLNYLGQLFKEFKKYKSKKHRLK